MVQVKVHHFEQDARPPVVARYKTLATPFRMLLAAWFGLGLIPFTLQTRSYIKFVTPHKITETLVAPYGAERETANLAKLCPVQGFFMSKVWWNVEPTHYYTLDQGRICHVVVPQYNLHGNYRVGDSTVIPFHTAPPGCARESYFFEHYFYHGSFGFYSFYEEAEGTYCVDDKTAYALVGGLGTYDINGLFLAQDLGDTDYRNSYWYGSVGLVWLIYRALILRRSYISCKRYARRCEQMGQELRRKPAIVFVHEHLRLSAHGATNYHRVVLLYLVVEGIMSDLFLLIAHDGFFAQLQYISIGYNLSGMLLLIFEIIERMKWLCEKWRVFVKRLLFNYESSLLGEFLSAAVQNHILVSLNRSRLKESRPVALTISYYVWSFLWHAVFVLCLIAFILAVRAVWAILYVLWWNRTLTIFTKPCCLDETLGMRCRMTMLDSYLCESGKLYYKADSLKAFGILRVMEENGAEFLSLNKLHWITVPRDNLVIIGLVSGKFVQPCEERTCSGVVSFFDRKLGGAPGSRHTLIGRRNVPTSRGTPSLGIIPSS